MDKYVTSVKKGLLKTFSRMGISTLRSFLGSQIFEAVGLGKELVENYFTNTASRIAGIGLSEIAAETVARHRRGFPTDGRWRNADNLLDVGGVYQVRVDGERHLWTPESVYKLQSATRLDDYGIYKEYAALINDQSRAHATLRSLFRFRKGTPVPLDEVEPVEKILPRFVTAAMSFGSISKETHETIAIAMNRIGGRSNSGEGGEDPERNIPLPNGDSRRSRIRQVASGRFGATTEYLVNADELQIKMAQGAKPGEGGQLPGHKVSPEIARIRHTMPYVTLISPPPHHDIYSIEDLAQLIYDLKSVNPRADVSVKLVSEVGVGTIAAGVAKAKADLVLIAGSDGGTGASPLTSIKHTGLPWELGLAETQQALIYNRLRDRIRVQVDGQLKTGRDLAIAALMGAEEFGFGTAVLVSLGCIMMRKCHLNTCPVGVATQDPVLRARFGGAPEYVVRFLRFVSEELREYMAELGFRTLDEMVGRVDLLEVQPAIEHWKAKGLDFSAMLLPPDNGRHSPLHRVRPQEHEVGKALDHEIMALARSRPGPEGAGPDRAADPQRPPVGGRGALRRDHPPLRGGGAARRHDPPHPPRLRGPELRGVPGPRRHDARARGRQRLPRQGDVGGTDRRDPPGGSDLPPAQERDRRKRGALRRHGRRGVLPRDRRGAVRGPQQRRESRRRGRGRPRVRVHDRRGRRGAGAHRGQLRRRDERGARLRLRRDGAVRHPLQPRHGRRRERLAGGGREAPPRHDREPLPVHGEPAGRADPRELGVPPPPVRQDHADRVPEVAGADAHGGGDEHRERLRHRGGLPWLSRPGSWNTIGRNRSHRPVTERVGDYREIEELLPEEGIYRQAVRCMDCGIPFCHAYGCPVKNRIPDWNDMVYRKNWRKALDLLHATCNLPEITGRVCPAPCEAACTLAINLPAVTIRHLELQIVEHGWREEWIRPEPAGFSTGKRVAVVGSGPAGLPAAQQLARSGHEVVVFEKSDRVGGLLRYGIPDFKLEKWVIDRRLDQMRAEGVVFETGVNAGVDVSAAYLRRSFDAIVLAAGATAARDLPVPGRDLKGVHFAMEFLTQQNRRNAGDTIPEGEEISAAGKHVVVIGGGDTGSDCIGTSRRQGAASITQIELLPKPPEDRLPTNPWPTWPVILRTSSSQEEGCERMWSVQTKAFLGEQGGVRKLSCVELDWTEPDAAGRRSFQEIPGSAFELRADLVLLAMGFVHVEHGPLVRDLGVATDGRGNLVADGNCMTNVPGVFGAGDAVIGASLVVRAIDLGRLAAAGADRYLVGR